LSLFSNPTPVYEVELVDDDGAVYLLIRTVDFDILHPPPTSKTMNRLLHVRPSIGQAIVNPIILDDYHFDAASSALAHADRSGKIPLGAGAKSIWGKTFKVRVTSKETCRKLDLNVKFETNHLKDTGKSCSVSITGTPPDEVDEVTS